MKPKAPTASPNTSSSAATISGSSSNRVVVTPPKTRMRLLVVSAKIGRIPQHISVLSPEWATIIQNRVARAYKERHPGSSQKANPPSAPRSASMHHISKSRYHAPFKVHDLNFQIICHALNAL
jgi:hypothetical protein